jgi:hypothetical protein
MILWEGEVLHDLQVVVQEEDLGVLEVDGCVMSWWR